jgi:rfaE bifunctional protein nucleotidyltransferase chain/domain
MKIAFLGDAFTDVFQDATVTKINPESGSLVYTLGEEKHYRGGVANAAQALCHFNVECRTYAQVLAKKHRIGENGPRLDTRLPQYNTVNTWNICLEEMRIFDPDAVVVSDYSGGFIDGTFLARILNYVHERDIPCVIDAKRLHRGIDYRDAIFKCNEHEYEGVRDSLAANSCDFVVTRGKHAPLINGGVAFDDKRFPARPFHCSGAGDVFAAFLAWRRASGDSLTTASKYSYVAAAAAGFFPPFRSPVLPREIEAIDTPERLKCLATDHEYMEWLMHRVPGTICATNGCFDLFHAGHAHMLQESRLQADQLIVLINSDSSIKALKGESRPFVGVFERMHVLAAMECVSAIACFAEHTPELILKKGMAALQRKFDVLSKGPDYTDAIGKEYALRFHRCSVGPVTRSSAIAAAIKKS